MNNLAHPLITTQMAKGDKRAQPKEKENAQLKLAYLKTAFETKLIKEPLELQHLGCRTNQGKCLRRSNNEGIDQWLTLDTAQKIIYNNSTL